jgi:hypothetical protein
MANAQGCPIGAGEMMKRPRRPKPTTTAHQRQLKAASNRRYYVRQTAQRDPVFKQLKDIARVYPSTLLDSEAADLAIDVDFEHGDKGKILRKFGYRAVIGSVIDDLVRDKLKEKRSKKK